MQADIVLTDAPPPGLLDAITANFEAHSAAMGLASDFRPLAVQVCRDGVLLGGLIGRTGRLWLNVQYLALPMHEHGAGLGRQVMGLAEQEAVRRGCTGAFLDTIQFQAPAFYQKLGYREFGRLEGGDPRLSRIWFTKRLV